MDYIKWNDSMSVDILTIDTQHKKLIEEINNFYNNLSRMKNNDVISELIFQLQRYSIYHFQTEEQLMKKFGFNGYEDHKTEHDRFIAKIDDVQNKLNNGKMVLTVELASFIKDWLTNHVMSKDKEYSKFLIECGVK